MAQTQTISDGTKQLVQLLEASEAREAHSQKLVAALKQENNHLAKTDEQLRSKVDFWYDRWSSSEFAVNGKERCHP